jgi:hypothetical protein
MSRRALGVLALVTAVALTTSLFVGGSAVGAPITLRARLTGEAEVPGPGDPNGRGRASITLNGAKRQVCFKIRWGGIKNVIAAHIHRGRRGVAGDIVVELFTAGDTGISGTVRYVRGCTKGVARAVIRRIRNSPKRYYVNVHTVRYPAGAIRGQLAA